jgi:hypothetical protein
MKIVLNKNNDLLLQKRFHLNLAEKMNDFEMAMKRFSRK